MRDPAGHPRRRSGPGGGLVMGILTGGLLASLLLVVAEFTTLFTVQTAASPAPVESVSTGSHHAYALLPIAVASALLAIGVWRAGSRPALLALGVLGVLTLLIALLGDLPDAHANGLLGTITTHYVNASATPGAGFFLETLGGLVLILTCGVGFLLLGPPGRPPGTRERSVC